jgi:molybdopterin-containing oxidoreductase family iron-sulfur binding subunit
MQQPVMDPLFNTRATADVLIAIARADAAMSARYPYATYRDFLMSRHPAGGGAFTEAVARGIGQGSVLARAATSSAATSAVAVQQAIAGDGEFFLVVHPSPALGTPRPRQQDRLAVVGRDPSLHCGAAWRPPW